MKLLESLLLPLLISTLSLNNCKNEGKDYITLDELPNHKSGCIDLNNDGKIDTSDVRFIGIDMNDDGLTDRAFIFKLKELENYFLYIDEYPDRVLFDMNHDGKFDISIPYFVDSPSEKYKKRENPEIYSKRDKI